MSPASRPAQEPTRPAAAARTTAADLARCLDCGGAVAGRPSCPSCGRPFAEGGGVFEAIGPLSGRNRVAAAFYDGPGWDRFRRWEHGFLMLQGGQRRARRPILEHLSGTATARVLEVGVGDGDNLPFLPAVREVFGVDISRRRLEGCLGRFPALSRRLVLAEAEALPFVDGAFDASLCVGGFNHFSDHAAALAEMRRVTRPGGVVVVADEIPTLHHFGLGHLLGLPRLDAWWLRRLGLDAEFVEMVLGDPLDLDALTRDHWPGARRLPVWNHLGYCLVGPSAPKAADEPRRATA